MNKTDTPRCVAESMADEYEKLKGYANRIAWSDGTLAEDAVQHAFSKAYEPDKFCKMINKSWPFNTIRRYVKKEWKRRRIFVGLPPTKSIEEKAQAPDFSGKPNNKQYLKSIKEGMTWFIRKRYPRAHALYAYFFDIWCYKEIWEYTWKEMQEKFPDTSMIEVQSRCSEILKEFNRYFARKKQDGHRRSPSHNR